MRIGIDLDDTIADHTNNLVKLGREYGVEHFGIDDIRSSALKKQLSEKEYSGLKAKLYGPISMGATPINGSKEILSELSNQNELYIISRRKLSREYAQRWLQMHFQFILTKNIYFVDEDEDKGALAINLDISLFLDNRWEVLEHMPPSVYPVLFDRFGQHKNTPFQRVASWNEFYKLLKRKN